MEQIFRRNSALDLIDKWKQVLAESTNEYYVMILKMNFITGRDYGTISPTE